MARKQNKENPNKTPGAIRKWLRELKKNVSESRISNTSMLRHIDWWVLGTMLIVSVFGLICIYAATGSPVEGENLSLLQRMNSQSLKYPGLQLMWIGIGIGVVGVMTFFDYRIFGRYRDVFYWANILLLLGVKFLTMVGRGNANMFFSLGERTIQPAEFGKIAMIIALARLFADRDHPVRTIRDVFWIFVYAGIPLFLVVIQPDIGTALVYVVILAILLLMANTDHRLILGGISLAVIGIVLLWFMMSYSDNFRIDRIQVWLDQNYDINDAGLQTYNARIELARGGLFGRGLFSVGNFAALNYVPDDHTDFIFAVLCETFGFVGGGFIIILYLILLLRMMYIAKHAGDAFGTYLVIGVMAMMFFHIFENISMVIGLMPVTGIPLPFVSYGGSSYLTNSAGIGLVLNVAMRSRAGISNEAKPRSATRQLIR